MNEINNTAAAEERDRALCVVPACMCVSGVCQVCVCVCQLCVCVMYLLESDSKRQLTHPSRWLA